MSPSDQFMESNQFFTCTRDPEGPCRITTAECARLYDRAKDGYKGVINPKWGGARHDLSKCLGCKIGAKNKKKAKAVKKIPVPGMYEAYNTKKCACGELIIRDWYQKYWIWDNTKWCDKCKELTPRQRQNKIARIRAMAEFKDLFNQARVELQIKSA